MELQIIGWVIGAAIVSVIVIAIVVSRMMCPPELFDRPEPPQPTPRDDAPPEGVQDLKEYRRGHWK